jgi:hypothetical protein
VTTNYPKDGSWLETIDRTVFRWKAYKPQAVKQMGKPGRWQKQVWTGDFFRWENCEPPEGVLCSDLTSVGPITAALAAAHEPCASVRLWSEQSPEPAPSHGGDVSMTWWRLEVQGVLLMTEIERHRWSQDRNKYTTYDHAPARMRELFEQLSEALKPKVTT